MSDVRASEVVEMVDEAYAEGWRDGYLDGVDATRLRWWGWLLLVLISLATSVVTVAATNGVLNA